MNYVGNFVDWIDQSWIDEIKSNDGWILPRDLLKKNPQVQLNEDEKKWFDSGYKLDSTLMSVFYKGDCSFNIKPPFSSHSWDWWIVKMMPGQFIPIHSDMAMATRNNTKSFWMPWQDWEPGHVFMYEDMSVLKYKKGDVFEDDSSIPHCAVNIGVTPRIILQVREYE